MDAEVTLIEQLQDFLWVLVAAASAAVGWVYREHRALEGRVTDIEKMLERVDERDTGTTDSLDAILEEAKATRREVRSTREDLEGRIEKVRAESTEQHEKLGSEIKRDMDMLRSGGSDTHRELFQELKGIRADVSGLAVTVGRVDERTQLSPTA